MYTSLKLSKLLAENGCDLETQHFYGKPKREQNVWVIVKKVLDGNVDWDYIPAYDILNDLCVKYAHEVFGTEWATMPSGDANRAFYVHPAIILHFLQQGRQEKAEDYLWKRCVFNPENK